MRVPRLVRWIAGAAERLTKEDALGSLAENPRRIGRELHLQLAGQHTTRRSEYRVINRIDDAEHQLSIIAVDHRRDVYRRR
jgi:mRNA-degrading endonuclease RelE of RelBE toxin-antitoxin system